MYTSIPRKEIQCASALLKEGRVFVQAYSETTAGVWIADGPVYTADVTSFEQIGQYVRDALRNSNRGIRHPTQAEWRRVQAPMLRAVGAKTWKALAKGARSVGLECEGGTITMTPSADYENDGGSELRERALTCQLSDDNIGELLLSALGESS